VVLCAALRFEIFTDPGRSEYVELDFCLHLYPNPWPFILIPVVLPQLCTQMNEMYHGGVASLSLLVSEPEFWLQYKLDILDIISGGTLTVKTVETRKDLHLR
jgi:hypothetical protein